MGLFSGGLTFGILFVYQIVGLIFGWANFRVGLLSGVYGIDFAYLIASGLKGPVQRSVRLRFCVVFIDNITRHYGAP